jgi:hypothetical protein
MTELWPKGSTSPICDAYFAACARSNEHRRHREEVSALPPLAFEEIWQLAMFDEPDVLIWDRIIDLGQGEQNE